MPLRHKSNFEWKTIKGQLMPPKLSAFALSCLGASTLNRLRQLSTLVSPETAPRGMTQQTFPKGPGPLHSFPPDVTP